MTTLTGTAEKQPTRGDTLRENESVDAGELKRMAGTATDQQGAQNAVTGRESVDTLTKVKAIGVAAIVVLGIPSALGVMLYLTTPIDGAEAGKKNRDAEKVSSLEPAKAAHATE